MTAPTFAPYKPSRRFGLRRIRTRLAVLGSLTTLVLATTSCRDSEPAPESPAPTPFVDDSRRMELPAEPHGPASATMAPESASPNAAPHASPLAAPASPAGDNP